MLPDNTRHGVELQGNQESMANPTGKTIFNLDYAFVQKAIPILGYFGVAGHIGFYLILHYAFGYWESWELRLTAAAGYLVLIFYPRERRLGPAHKAFFEATIALTMSRVLHLSVPYERNQRVLVCLPGIRRINARHGFQAIGISLGLSPLELAGHVGLP